MASGWSVTDALNRNSKAALTEKPKARFRTKDISIKKMYSSVKNFYSMPDIKQLAQDILAVGLLENITVLYAPTEKGEYRIISGERRFRALQMLVEEGHDEFEVATCQLKTAADEHEEQVMLILANSYRNKTVADILEEEQQLKESLQYMKDNGIELQGYSLDSGRLRDVIADILNTTATKIAQIESINKRLMPEFIEELKEGRLTFSAAYEISGMQEENQEETLKRYKEENGLTLKEVKEIKKQEGKIAEQTSTAADIGEQKEQEKMQQFPSQQQKQPIIHRIRLGAMLFGDTLSKKKNFDLRKNAENYQIGDILEILEYRDGRETGRVCRRIITYILEDFIGLEEGYCILGFRALEERK